MTYNVFGGTLNLALSLSLAAVPGSTGLSASIALLVDAYGLRHVTRDWGSEATHII